jgi:uncharacterized protein
MAVYFLNSSAVVKRHIAEAGSQWLSSLITSAAGHDFHVAEIALVEVVSALVRRRNRGDITQAQATSALADFRHDWRNVYGVIAITTAVTDRAAALVERRGLRAFDAVQLSAALELAARLAAANLSLMFVSADAELNSAAEAENLSAENPNDYQ